MADLCSQLDALSRWLAAAKRCQGEEAYKSLVAKSYTSFKAQLVRQRLSMEKATLAMQAVAASEHWTQDQKAALCSALSAQAVDSEHVTRLKLGSRQQCQDFTAFLYYLPARLCELLKSTDAAVDQNAKAVHLSAFLVSLGLRFPTETTVQAFATLFLQLPHAQEYAMYQQRHQLFIGCKEILRRATDAAAPLADKPYVSCLPSDFRELPKQWRQSALQDHAAAGAAGGGRSHSPIPPAHGEHAQGQQASERQH